MDLNSTTDQKIIEMNKEIQNIKTIMEKNHQELKELISSQFNAQKEFIQNNNKENKEAIIQELKKEISQLSMAKDEIKNLPQPQKEISESFDELIHYKDNPNELINYMDIATDANVYWYSNNAIFTSYKNNDSIIVYYTDNPYNLVYYNINKFSNDKIINNAFNKDIITVRHYDNKSKKQNWIIASSKDKTTKIWDHDYNNILIIKTPNVNDLSSSFIINNNNQLYIIISDYKNEINIYDSHGKFKNDLGDNSKDSNYADVYYDDDGTPYVIQCNNKGVYSFNFIESKLYQKYLTNPAGECRGRYIINNLNNIKTIITSDYYPNHKINLFNFYTGELIRSIVNNISNSGLYGLTLWNKEYAFVGDGSGNVLLLNINEGEFKCKLNGHGSSSVTDVKKMIHHSLGEILISQADDGKIKVWKNKNK